MSENRIITDYWSKPIPIRAHDWSAFYDGDQPNDAGCMDYGSGYTEAEAVVDLIVNHPRPDVFCPERGR